MRIAILSDIHANLPALRKTFDVIERNNIDRIICLGDIIGYGAHPNECVELVQQRCSHVVLGNHDAVATGALPMTHFNRPGRAAMQWTLDTLSKNNLDYLASLPLITEYEHATFVHASPTQPEDWTYITSPWEAKEAFAAMTTDLCFFGHTHVPGLLCEEPGFFQVKKGRRFLVNVGSVGQPRDGNPQLSFGIFDTGGWTYENIRLDYEVQQAADAILRHGLPPILAERLFQGI